MEISPSFFKKFNNIEPGSIVLPLTLSARSNNIPPSILSDKLGNIVLLPIPSIVNRALPSILSKTTSNYTPPSIAIN